MPLYLLRPSLPYYGFEDTEINMGQIGISIWKAWWLEGLPAWKWTHVSPTFQFQDSEWFLYKVQAYCFPLEAMQSGEGGWSAHPSHPLQTQVWLFSFCFYIPCGEAHNPWMEDAFIESQTSEHDKLVQMGIIRSSSDQALHVSGPKDLKGKGKQ